MSAENPLVARAPGPCIIVAVVPGPETTEYLLQALDRTLETGGARARFTFAQQFKLPESSPRRRGGLLRPLVRVGSFAGRRAFTAGLGKLGGDLVGEGYIDFGGHRSAFAYGSFAVMVVGDRMWMGRSGTPIATLPEERASWLEPLWLIDLVRGVTDFEVRGEELVGDRTCQRLYAYADLGRAAAASPSDLPVPTGADRYGDLLRLPLELWIDEQNHIRRARQGDATVTLTLDLLEFGAEDGTDWSRLPHAPVAPRAA